MLRRSVATTVPFQCHDQPSRTILTNSSFVNNEETVVHLDVGECGALEVARNSFLENNNSGQEGVMMVNAEPREGVRFKAPIHPVRLSINYRFFSRHRYQFRFKKTNSPKMVENIWLCSACMGLIQLMDHFAGIECTVIFTQLLHAWATVDTWLCAK